MLQFHIHFRIDGMNIVGVSFCDVSNSDSILMIDGPGCSRKVEQQILCYTSGHHFYINHKNAD